MTQKQENQSDSSDAAEIRKLLQSSPYFLKLADSILESLDREAVAELIVGYLYFRSSNRKESDLVHFVLSNKMDVVLRIAGKCLPVVLPGLISDKEFRSLITSAAARWVQGK